MYGNGPGYNRPIYGRYIPQSTIEENEGSDDVIEKARETCETHHQFIASQAEHLERLRSQCVTSSQLTQQEIRTLEGKLVKLFSLQLVTKRNLPVGIPLPAEMANYPSLRQWLMVVGLCPDSVDGMCDRVSSFENLLEKSDHELHTLMSDSGGERNEALKLARALQNLRKYTEVQMHNQPETSGDWSSCDLPLYWDSWERSCPTSPRLPPHSRGAGGGRECRSSVSSSDGDGGSITSGSCGTTGSSSWEGGRGGLWGYRGGAPVTSQRSSDESSTPSSPPPPPFGGMPSPSPGGSLHPAPNLTLPASSGGVGSFVERRYTPPPTPPVNSKGRTVGEKKFPTTPPPGKKYQTGLLAAIQPASASASLGRSTSHESQLAYRIEPHDYHTAGVSEAHPNRRNRLHSESEASGNPLDGPKRDTRESRTAHNSPAPSTLASPIKSPNFYELPEEESYVNKNTLLVPKSPRTPTLHGSMVHNVQHRFERTIKPATCGYCCTKFNFLGGLRCKECNFKCHRECEPKVPPSCGLPHEFLRIFADTLRTQGRTPPGVSPSHAGGDVFPSPLKSTHSMSYSQPSINVPTFGNPDSSSNTSSCNSSTPSSPALFISSSPAIKHTFHFPDVNELNNRRGDIPLDMRPLTHFNPRPVLSRPPLFSSGASHVGSDRSEVVDSRHSHDSDRTVSQTSGSGSTGTDDSERTLAGGGRVGSQDSTLSEGDGESMDSRCTRQNSVSSVSQSLREWDIPYDELDRGEVIGMGRFGTVYSGNWHGQVAIKELHMDYVDDEKTLEAFKGEVSIFRNTRHENLVLFMGACMKPPRLAIVTSLCKGNTLYRHVHVLKDKFNMSRTVMIAQQISQGMGYLHARGIVHKDLKTKNIFLESGKIVITDFGLFNVTRLCRESRQGNWLSIPPGWLCYLSPEIMRSLRVVQKPSDPLPFTTFSDMYSFGTVWYELLCGEWPHRGLPPEAIIWQVGRGMKPSLAHLQAPRDLKDILMTCWSFRPDERPEFASMLQLLTRLPKKRLHRSPSHPVHLSRSAESVF